MIATPRPFVRRASLIAGTLVAGTLAATAPLTSAQAAGLPVLPSLPITCDISLSGLPTDGIPVVGQVLTSHITLNKTQDLLGLNLNLLPVTSAVVAVLPGSTPSIPGVPAGTPLDTVTYTVTNADIGKQIVPVGQVGLSSLPAPVGPLLTTLSSLFTIPATIPCTTTPSGPVVEAPTGPGSTTTLGATPVSSSPRVVGKAKKGKRVRAELGTVQPGVTATYQWFKMRKHHAPRAIGGATGATYKLKGAIRGKRISVVVTYSKAGYTPTVLSSGSRRVR